MIILEDEDINLAHKFSTIIPRREEADHVLR